MSDPAKPTRTGAPAGRPPGRPRPVAHGLKPPGRFQRTVTGVTRRLEKHIIPLGLVVTAIGVLLAWIAWSSVNGVPFQDRYELKAMVPKDSPILQKGDAVRIAGRLAGLVTDVESRDGATEIHMELRPQYAVATPRPACG
jgi:hypothetical protein